MIEHEVEPYSVLEVQRLIEAAKHERNGVRWVVALVLGLGQGEALGLKWDDIDWTTGLLSVKRSRTRPRYEHGCQPNCGHKYAGHCPEWQDVRPPTNTTKGCGVTRIVEARSRLQESSPLRTRVERSSGDTPIGTN